MDVNLITDLSKTYPGSGRIYQGGTPDNSIINFEAANRDLLLVEMAFGVDADQWIRQGTLKSVLYFGIEDSPDACLDDPSLISLAMMSACWVGKGGDVLFGCAAGVSRSSYANCATLMLIEKLTFDQALALIRAARPQANPNSGFAAQLKRLEPVLLGMG